MHIIPIIPGLLDIIEVLNNGVRPKIEYGETYFVWYGKDKPSEIITNVELMSDKYPVFLGITVMFQSM